LQAQAPRIVAGRCQHSLKHTIKLFRRQILTDVATRTSAHGRADLPFIATVFGKHNDGQVGIDRSNRRDQRGCGSVLRLEIDNDHFAAILVKPIEGFVGVERSIARMASFGEIGGKEFGKLGVTIDEEKFGGAVMVLHCYKFNSYNSNNPASLSRGHTR